MKEISQDSLAARDGNIQEGDVVLKVQYVVVVVVVQRQNSLIQVCLELAVSIT